MVKLDRVLTKKLGRDIWHNFLQFIAIIFILATSVALFIGLTSSAYELEKRVNETYSKGNLADVWITVNSYNDDDYKKLISFNNNEEENINSRLVSQVRIANYSTYALVSKDLPTINKAFDVDLKENYEENNSDLFFYVDNAFKDRFTDLEIGDYLDLNYQTSLLKNPLVAIIENLGLGDTFTTDCLKHINTALPSDETVLSFKVNAFMSQPENIQNATFNSAYCFLGSKYLFNKCLNKIIDSYTTIDKENPYSSLIVFESLNKEILDKESARLDEFFKYYMNQYVVKLDDALTSKKYIDNVNNYFNDNNRLISIMNKENLPSNSVIQNDIVQAKQLTYVFPIIFFVVAILIVLTTISQMILKQRTQIGTMKALGLTKNRILFYYQSLMVIVSLIGVALGFIIGPYVIAPVMNNKYKLLYTLPEYSTYWPVTEIIIVTIIVILLVALLTSLIIHHELKETPVASMRPLVPRFSSHGNKKEIKNTSLMMALRNMKVHMTKSLMVIIGIMGCTGLLICGFGIDDTIEYDKNVDINNVYNSDVNVAYNPQIESLKNDIESIDGVKYCEEYAILSVQANNDNEDTFINTNIFYFDSTATNFGCSKWDNDGVGLSQSIADSLKIIEGDYLEFTYNGETYKEKVNKVFYTFSVKAIFIYRETLKDLSPYNTNAWVTINDGANGKSISSQVKNITGVNSTQTRQERLDTVNSYVSAVSAMTIVVKVFAVILAVIVLINLAILNFNERIREIATLRVLGFKRREIAASLIYEVMFLTIIGASFGLLIGFPLTYIVLYVNITPLVSYYYYIQPLSYILGFIISVVTAFVVNLLITKRINKVDMAESLKSVE
jgi:putative ABC transport system permease protein